MYSCMTDKQTKGLTMQNTSKNNGLGQAWAIVATIEASEAIGVDPLEARGNLALCCAIADSLGQRQGVKASGRTIDPRKVQALLIAAL